MIWKFAGGPVIPLRNAIEMETTSVLPEGAKFCGGQLSKSLTHYEENLSPSHHQHLVFIT